jgi:hypothetical protein
MKKGCMLSLIFILIIFFNENLSATAEKETKNHVSINWVSNPENVHYTQPVVAEIYNESDTEKEFNISSGTLLEPSDENCQTLVVTNSVKGKVAPKKLIKVNVNAMCTQNSKSGGYMGLKYKSKEPADSILTSLAKFIEAKKYFSSEGQLAVWAWTNKSGIENIYGADTIACLALQQKLAQLTHKTVPTFLVKSDYSRNYYVPVPPKTSIGGNFEYQLSKPREVCIGMFNENGVLVRELFKQKNVTPGKHTFDYEFDATVYNDDKYKILFILDGKIILTQPLELKQWRDEFLRNNR